MTSQQKVKKWVVQKAVVTSPFMNYWSVSVTLGGMDINGTGDTIEKAYNALVVEIITSKSRLKSFNALKYE